jgi:prevent-host-death family protein
MVMKRVGIAEAKAHLSEIVREASAEPVVIHNRGKDVAVVVDAGEYERLVEAAGKRPTAGGRLVESLRELRAKYGGGYELEFEHIDFPDRNPFVAPRKKRAKKR